MSQEERRRREAEELRRRTAGDDDDEPSFRLVTDEPALLPCGCPEQIVHDEGHQEGCTEREAVRDAQDADAS